LAALWRSKLDIWRSVGAMLIVMALFAEFFSPNPPSGAPLQPFIPPQKVYFIDESAEVLQ
jgi:hypothetical protein